MVGAWFLRIHHISSRHIHGMLEELVQLFAVNISSLCLGPPTGFLETSACRSYCAPFLGGFLRWGYYQIIHF